MSEFDYVVAGGGSAGCVVASRLSEDPGRSVCLLEAGGRDDSAFVHCPAGVVAMVPTRLNNWAFQTVPQPGLGGRRGYQPRGRVLGGSSSINAMIYIRGHRSDYDRWAALGNRDWSFAEVLPYFKRAEHNEQFRDELHGSGGPLNVAALRTGNPFQERFVAAAEQVGLKRNADFNGTEQEGVGAYQVTQKDGERCSAAKAYLTPYLSRPNLRVITGAAARRVVLEGGRAVGVELEQGGARQMLRARREVIVSAGALQSPQLLMLSGIGDGEALRRHGIAVVRHLPGVGRNLQDHIDYLLCYRSGSNELFGLAPAFALRFLKYLKLYREERRGMLTTNYAEAGGFVKSEPAQPLPDLQLHFMIAMAENHARTPVFGMGFGCHVCVLRPKSVGHLELASADPRAAPLIDPGFLTERADVETLIRGFRLARRILEAPALAPFRGEPLRTARVHTDEEIERELRRRCDTLYHPVGTCRMGTDDHAVVDPELKVRGVDGLRVVDASVMPTLIGGNTNAPTIMIGEKAADLIRGGGA